MRAYLVTVGVAVSAAFLVPARGLSETMMETLEKEVIALVGKASPSMVSVVTEPLASEWPRFFNEGDSPAWFRKFFQDRSAGWKRKSRGSGFVIDPSGYILTTETVVNGAREVEVTLSDQRTLPARVIGKDRRVNLALLKVKGDNLPFLPLGRSGELTAGSLVIAIGNPFGLSASPSLGLVSGVHRSGLGTAPYEDLIQITAPINPGDSGGPLLTPRGEVVGVLTATLSGYREFEFDWSYLRRLHQFFPPEEGSYPGDFFQPSLAQGIGFAIPADLAREIVERLKREPAPDRGWLGIRIGELSPAQAAAKMLSGGVLVIDVFPESPAARAGVKSNDIIVSLDQKELRSPGDLQRAVMFVQPGTEVVLDLWREGEKISVLVTVAPPPPDNQGESN